MVQAESHMTLVTDSWTNVRSEAIVNYVFVTANGEASFYSADPTGTESHTGLYLARNITEVVDDVGLIKDVLKSLATYRHLSRSSPRNILTYSGSDAYRINSIWQSKIFLALAISKVILSEAVEMAKWFRNHHSQLEL
ncbi:hypothetical protein V1525DRAFT_438464 [Lipomyces kononenkoae]|uniref:Uncharacterized protein n=1 Tax=Lipomyces kononenkoae TaxID=34357 RepID=A0ACC3T5J5_LIPKO